MKSGLVIAAYESRAGGTQSAMAYAEKSGKKVVNVLHGESPLSDFLRPVN